MNRFFLAGMLLWGTTVFGQSEQKLQSFSQLVVDAPVQVILANSNEHKVSGGHLKAFDFEVKNGVLTIGLNENSGGPVDDLTLYFVQLESIKLLGSSQISAPNDLNLNKSDFKIEAAGASKIQLGFEVEELLVQASGASKLSLKGKANLLKLELTGASRFNGEQLATKEAWVIANGAAYFNVDAKEILKVEATGASKGVYNGDPQSRIINISGAADIIDASTGKRLADERENPGDTTRIKLGKKKLIIIDGNDELAIEEEIDEEGNEGEGDIEIEEKKMYIHTKNKQLKKVYAGFELGMGALTTNQLNFSMPSQYSFLETNMSKSWFYGLNLLEGDVILVKNRLALTSGLGMEFQNLAFNTNQILTPAVSIISADSGSRSLTRNRLYSYNINVPLLIKFAPRTRKSKNGFHVAAGLIGTFKAYNHLRLESAENGYKEEAKIKDDFNINTFRLGATVRVGYGWFRAFANYSLTPYFKTQSNNPDIRNFSAGITLIPFDY